MKIIQDKFDKQIIIRKIKSFKFHKITWVQNAIIFGLNNKSILRVITLLSTCALYIDQSIAFNLLIYITVN